MSISEEWAVYATFPLLALRINLSAFLRSIYSIMATITRMPQNNGAGVDNEIYSVLTYKTTINEAPAKVQSWIKECDSAVSDIYVKEYDGRYWIYANVIGDGNNYGFKSSSESDGACMIEIIPIESESGSGYALLSAPAKYNHLSVRSGEYTIEISK